MIEFHPFSLQDKVIYEQYLFADSEHGCECSFANRYLWGQQESAFLDGYMVLHSQFGRRSAYPFPLGTGDKRKVLDAIIADVEGAYTAINCEFARYIRHKYPQIRFLNREENMGLEGLRKAKESYLPHHMVEKYWASLSKNA